MNSMDYAIQTEIDGAAFYSEQADLYKGTTLFKVFTILAKEENQHEMVLRRVSSDSFSELPGDGTMSNANTIFSNLDDFKDEIRTNPKQIEVYRLARDMEQKSVDLYEKMMAEAKNDSEKDVFKYLVGQEKHHYQMMDEFVIRIGRPEEWVESAEFGERADY
jgi:rubrerythrin